MELNTREADRERFPLTSNGFCHLMIQMVRIEEYSQPSVPVKDYMRALLLCSLNCQVHRVSK